MLICCHQFIDGILELKLSLVLDGETGLFLVVDDHAPEIDVVNGTDGEAREHSLGTDTDGDVGNQFTLLTKVYIYHLKQDNRRQ